MQLGMYMANVDLLEPLMQKSTRKRLAFSGILVISRIDWVQGKLLYSIGAELYTPTVETDESTTMCRLL